MVFLFLLQPWLPSLWPLKLKKIFFFLKITKELLFCHYSEEYPITGQKNDITLNKKQSNEKKLEAVSVLLLRTHKVNTKYCANVSRLLMVLSFVFVTISVTSLLCDVYSLLCVSSYSFYLMWELSFPQYTASILLPKRNARALIRLYFVGVLFISSQCHSEVL